MSNSSTTTTTSQTAEVTILGYDASMVMAWMGGIIFTVALLFHGWQYIKHRAFYLYLLMLGITS